ncbi:MAG TPA: hypothetical protein VMC81_08165 [Rhodocyclaceae bacterium]|nr:hypothetical protein [Rhodocyclaceae bacterium]
MTTSPTGQQAQDGGDFDLAFPPDAAPSPNLLAAAGEAGLRELVVHHHDLLRKSSVGHLFPRDKRRFDDVVARIAGYVVAMAGAEPGYAETHGATWFRVRHLALTIDEPARNVWLAALLVAFDDVGFPQQARAEFWNWVESLSVRAITRRTMIGQPRRYPFAEAPAALKAFTDAYRRR